ncbi:Stage 0 sporulation protein YaaT [Alteracholeplasma palmae J233]|uniref:Stage 0 sporulation protein YaaT n=1 Tax=Alteracholeplasma palmae (strain ATCC 49389 / J233) TaxID=1318466 RepID=U4KLT1_ALTPJ|nr:regulatory iron-sulfur-containing complex subunit RicT [Alteracholeplasma palmae]CCV64887.1 Stage 0 sporulation protein YaaT [Alteracholeplasma palmae J233]
MKVALVQFKTAGKKYYFGLNNLNVTDNSLVVVETIRGLEIGKVSKIKEIDDSEIETQIKPIIRMANEEDLFNYEENQLLNKDVYQVAKQVAFDLKLKMKIVDAEYTLDRKKLLVYFESDDRIDFRELIKVLNQKYKTRLELRQIGSRDAAKIIGGIGPCGLILCCSTFIGEFDTISIKMAKNQNLSLNPQKISGVCGKLLCCIKYDDDVYTDLKEKMPDVSDMILVNGEKVLVVNINVLGQKIQIKHLETSSYEWISLESLESNGN